MLRSILLLTVLVVGLMLWGCSFNSTDFEVNILQDSNYQELPSEEIELKTSPFKIIVSYYSWEMQAADTSVSVRYSFTDDISLLPQYQQAKTMHDIGFGKSLLIKDLSAKIERKTKQQTLTYEREKGNQTCEFTNCREAPEQVHLEIEIASFNDMPMKDMIGGKIVYALEIVSESESNMVVGVLSFDK
jgi:hypothetical protein